MYMMDQQDTSQFVNNMEKEFVTYNQAVKLKGLGLNINCFGWYSDNKDFHLKRNVSIIDINQFSFLAPLKQQVFRWFRDNHQLFYTIETNCSQLSFEWGFDYTIFDKENDKWLSTEPQNCPPGETTYVTYEEAESACIYKLIEIVKNK